MAGFFLVKWLEICINDFSFLILETILLKILFIHQNFPGQFKFLAPALKKNGYDVVAMLMSKKQIDN